MAAPRLSDPHALEDGIIDVEVTATSPGVFALDSDSEGPFTVAFVGRADTDLNPELHRYVRGYRFFKFAYCSSAKDAFEAECELYHDKKPPHNISHPVGTAGANCPRCNRQS